MSRVCQLTGKGYQSGYKVSHSNRKSLKRQQPNLQKKRFFVASQNRFITLRVSVAAIREVDRRGIDVMLQEATARGFLSR